jgi:endonuclease-3
MKMTERVHRIECGLALLYPDADCELNFHSILDLVVAVILSAQTTDKQVNVVTRTLFKKYKTLTDYADADVDALAADIQQIGLYRSKAKYIKAMSQRVIEQYDGKFPQTIAALTTLPGIGRKTANVVISVGFGKPGFAVDTHVERVSKRLGLVRVADNVDTVERKLKKAFPRDHWSKLHHQFIFFGRYTCKARTPLCTGCPFQDMCRYYKKNVLKGSRH